MDIFTSEKIRALIEKMRKKRTLLLILAALVVFVTTYMLVLPAFTLDKEEAADQGGITLTEEKSSGDETPGTKESEQESPKDDQETASKEETSGEPELASELEFQGEGYTVAALCDEKAEVPADTELTAEEISKSDDEDTYKDYYKRALKAVRQDAEANQPEGSNIKGKNLIASLKYAHFYDITLNADGEELEPAAAVGVSISFDKALEVADPDHVKILHFTTDPETREAVTEVLDPETVDLQLKKEKMTSATFTAESFSVYGIVYTVDFEYSVNGKMYQYSLLGGGFVSFTDLVEVLGITGDTNSEGNGDETESVIVENAEENAANDVVEENSVNFDTNTALTLGDVEVSEATRKFVADVASVEFSTPSLVDVSKVEADTTVGQIKEGRGLECEYSAELTEEQIAEINAQTVEAGDWALISVQPFTSEETLTVTMKDGEVFTIRVTDAQIKKTVIDAKGDTWEITVTYGEDAQIPDGAELRVEEILPEDEGYEEYYQKSLEKVGVSIPETEGSGEVADALIDDAFEDAVEELTDLIVSDNDEEEIEEPAKKAASDYARIFDIEIWADDHKVEPVADVTVNIKLLNAPGETEATPQVVHFAEDGAELMELKVKDENSEDEGIQFVTDEFSVYSVVYTVDFSFNINGKEYAFSLEGGDSTSFKEIIEKFEILDKENAELFIDNISSVEFTNPDYLWNGKLTEDAFVGDLKEKNNLDIQYASNIRQGNILAMNNHHYSAPDWVLIALKPFTSEETLTVTMKNGEVFTVKVTDAQSDAIHNSDGTVQTIPNPQGTTIDLFNYYVDSATKTTSGRDQWPGHIHNDTDFWMFNWYDLDGNYACDWGEGFNRGYNNNDNYLLGYGNNLGINHNHILKFSPANAGTVIDGTKGTATKDVEGGSGLNGWTQDADPNQGIVQGTLVNGYPVMTEDDNLGTNGEPLSYLFDNTSQEGKDSYGNVNNLLYIDPDGYYTYDSRDFKAEYQSNGTFKVSDQPDTTDTEVKGFWPFGTNVYWCGLHMNTQFSMPESGQVLNPKDELKDMQFEFSGDDDTWLYVDGVLVGDGGGIHNRTEIDINFATGKVTVTGKKDSVHTGSFEETKWLDDIFRAAGKYNEADWEDIGDGSGHKRFKAGTYHTFDMFYLERGGGESNLYIHYNLVSTDDFTGHKSYEGFAEDERMARDQFRFEMIGLDGQYQSVWNSETQSAEITLLDSAGRAIMPSKGSESGEGTFADPRKVYSSSAYTDSNGITHGGTVLTTGVLENGDIRFGSAEISAEEMLACDQGRPSLYRYIIREIVPDDAVNEEGITWAEADAETREEGGFVKDQVLYDGEVYYMTARVTSWNQTGSDGQTYKAYGLSKTYYKDDTFTEVDNDVAFVDFRNLYAPDSGSVEFAKVDGMGNPLAGATFTLYTDKACTKVAKDLEGVEQVITTEPNGKVSFDNMAAPKAYYMKETAVPSGYDSNNTVYQVIIEDSKDGTKHSRIIALDDESESEITKIINVKPGEFSVIKEWQNQAGQETEVNDKTVRVKIQRQHYGGGSGVVPHTVNFTIGIQNNPELVYTYTKSVSGGVVTVDWWDTNQTYSTFEVTDGNGNPMTTYTLSDYWDNVNHKNRKAVISNVLSDIDIRVTYPNGVSWLFNSEHTPWMKDVSVVGNGEPAIPPELEEDLDFNNSTENNHFAVLSSPAWSRKWTIGGTASDYSGYDFPASDGTNPYKYYVVEVDENGDQLQIGKETEDGFKLAGYVNASGVTTVVNEIIAPETIDIQIKKTDNTETNYLNGAVFKLEYRENSDGTFTNVSRTVVPELDANSQFTVPTVGITLTGLADGEYRIQEITPPPGYVVTQTYPVVFTVSGGNITSTEGTISEVKYTAATQSADAEFTIPNTPGAALPNTGGPGTRLFTILGSILILGAGVLLWRRRKLI